MKLRKVIFYQSVRLWDNREYHTVNLGENDVDIVLIDHLVHLNKPGLETIVVPTANMRMGIQLGVTQGANPSVEIRQFGNPAEKIQSGHIVLKPEVPEVKPEQKKGKKK